MEESKPNLELSYIFGGPYTFVASVSLLVIFYNAYKMQLETADFAPIAPHDELHETRAVFDSGLFALLCENMTSSTKPEVHNILQYHHRKTEPWPQLIYR